MSLLERAAVPTALLVGTAALASLTLGTRPPAPPPTSPPTATAPSTAPTLRLGPPTPTGVAIHRPAADGDGLEVTMVDVHGAVRWERSTSPDGALPVCAPCPAAWLVGTDGISAVDGDGRPAPAGEPAPRPPTGAPVRTLGVGQPVLVVGDGPPTSLWTVTPHGPSRLADVRPEVVADPRVQAAAAIDGTAVTLVGPHPDPLRLAEARITHVTGRTTATVDEAVPDAGTRLHPCVATDDQRWGYLLAGLGQGPATGRATLVTHGPEGERRTELPTFLDACSVGSTGDLAWTTTIGRPGGPVAEVDLVAVHGQQVDADTRSFGQVPSVAADVAGARLAVVAPAGGVLLDGVGERPLDGAAAVAIDVEDGLWLADADPLHVRRTTLPPPP